MIDISGLKANYQAGVDLIFQVNNGSLTLYYNAPQVPTTGAPGAMPPFGLNALGGRSSVVDTIGSQFVAGQHIEISGRSETISVRSYWETKKSGDESYKAGIRDREDVLKIISVSADRRKLLNAVYAECDGIKVKLIRHPVPHGLVEKVYDTSYWEIID